MFKRKTDRKKITKDKKPFDLDVVVLWIAGVAIVVFFIYAQVAG